jgi:hypothetical protein
MRAILPLGAICVTVAALVIPAFGHAQRTLGSSPPPTQPQALPGLMEAIASETPFRQPRPPDLVEDQQCPFQATVPDTLLLVGGSFVAVEMWSGRRSAARYLSTRTDTVAVTPVVMVCRGMYTKELHQIIVRAGEHFVGIAPHHFWTPPPHLTIHYIGLRDNRNHRVNMRAEDGRISPAVLDGRCNLGRDPDCRVRVYPLTVILDSLRADSVVRAFADQRRQDSVRAEREAIAARARAETEAFLAGLEAERRAEREAAAVAEAERRRAIRAMRWPEATKERVLNRRIAIGMTAEMVRLAWGGPTDINRTTTVRGIWEQWVYGDGAYVYLQNGVVTAFQN